MSNPFEYESPYPPDPEMEKEVNESLRDWTPGANSQMQPEESESGLRNAPFKALPSIKIPQTKDWSEFSKEELAKPKPLIQNLLDCGSRILFGGGSKTFKTWLQCDLALSVACGCPWLGFETCQARVLYVNFELREYYIQKRFASIQTARDISIPSKCLHVLNLRGVDIGRKALCEHLLTLSEKLGINLVFIDPFYKLLTAEEDENNQSKMASVFKDFDPINKKDVTTAYGIHFSKGNQAGKDPEDRISGAGSIVRDPDNVITLTKHETNHAFTVDFIIRDHPPIDPFVIQWEAPIMVRSDLDPAKIKKPTPGRSTQFTLQPIVDIIEANDDELSTKELEAKALEDLGMVRSTFYVKLSQIKKQKLARLSKLTNKWTV